MDLLETLGADGELFRFPVDQINRTIGSFEIRDYQTQNLLLANYAELGVFSAAIVGELVWPLELPPGLLQAVVYKTNTITYTCGYHRGLTEPRSEYAFLFTSDCWKLREILGEEPLRLLVDDPMRVRQRIIESGWQVSPHVSNQAEIRDVTLLLWHAKASLIDNPRVRAEQLNRSIYQLRGRLELPGSRR
jgi:hypothetical protein